MKCPVLKYPACIMALLSKYRGQIFLLMRHRCFVMAGRFNMAQSWITWNG